jgi:hypothetical protein
MISLVVSALDYSTDIYEEAWLISDPVTLIWSASVWTVITGQYIGHKAFAYTFFYLTKLEHKVHDLSKSTTKHYGIGVSRPNVEGLIVPYRF